MRGAHHRHAQADREDPNRLQQPLVYITMSALLALVGSWDEQYGPEEDIFLEPCQTLASNIVRKKVMK
jgi:hypothetical protein